MSGQDIYEQARRHGLSHDAALLAVEAGKVSCWCGSETPCVGGAQRMVGCPMISTPYTNHEWVQTGDPA